jgi:hypothetical protein
MRFWWTEDQKGPIYLELPHGPRMSTSLDSRVLGFGPSSRSDFSSWSERSWYGVATDVGLSPQLDSPIPASPVISRDSCRSVWRPMRGLLPMSCAEDEYLLALVADETIERRIESSTLPDSTARVDDRTAGFAGWDAGYPNLAQILDVE